MLRARGFLCRACLSSSREGIPFSQIIEDYYPELEPEDIRACVQYAIDVVAVEDHPPGTHAMRFLADQDVYAVTIRLLSGMGHDVVTASQLGLARARTVAGFVCSYEPGRHRITVTARCSIARVTV